MELRPPGTMSLWVELLRDRVRIDEMGYLVKRLRQPCSVLVGQFTPFADEAENSQH